jgi:tetratricopeptide (TPR) repeat protein
MEEPGEVAKAYRRAADLFRRLSADFPSNPEYRRHLAQCESSLGSLPEAVVPRVEAERARQHALELREALVKEHQDHDGYRCDLAESYRIISVLDRKHGDAAGAERMLVKGLDLLATPVGEQGESPEHLRALSRLHDNLGNLLRLVGPRERFEKAEAESRHALKLRSRLVDDRPRSPAYRLELARSYNNLGAILHEKGSHEAAVENYKRAEERQRELASEFPHVLTYREERARSLVNLGDADLERGRWKTAEPNYLLALGINKRLAEEFSDQPDYRSDLARTYYSLALLHSGRGPEGADEAGRDFNEALRLQEELVRKHPENLEYQKWFAKFGEGLAKLRASK